MSIIAEGAWQTMSDEVSTASPINSGRLPSHPASSGHYYARFGTLLLVDKGATAPMKAFPALTAALDADTRVTEVRSRPVQAAWSHVNRIYPQNAENTSVDLSLADQTRNLHVRDPLLIEIRVPIKNQPLFHDEDDVPSDTYWATWDGTTVVVLWERPKEQELPPRSGGHIALEIFQKAAVGAGFAAVIQACSPHCQNRFAHRVMRISQFPGDEQPSYREHGFPVVETHLHSDGDAADVAIMIAEDLARVGEQFAIHKSYARRILDIEKDLRARVSQLLALDWKRSNYARRNALFRIASGLWQGAKSSLGRGDSQTSRWLIANLWLGMSSIEVLRRDWADTARHLNDASRDAGRADLYSDDRKDDDASIAALDIAFVRAAVEQKASQFDNRIIAWATLAGAAAAIVATLIAASLTP
jgi:hypothetical protein